VKFSIQFVIDQFPQRGTNQQASHPIDHMMTDSRIPLENSLFIPIVGDNFNGHDFIAAAIENGAVASLWDMAYTVPQEVPDDFPLIFVKDTLDALQSLAHAYRKKVNPTVIGITGSNGKTTTKDIVYSIVKEQFNAYCTQGNFNNLIGLPLTILQMERKTEVLVLEMGMDTFGEIERLSEIAEPDYGIITNIGESHIEYLGSRQGIAQAKLEIKKHLHDHGILFVDGDEALLGHLKEGVRFVGQNKGYDTCIHDIHVSTKDTTFTIHGQSFTVPLIGVHHAKNTALAIELAHELNMTDSLIQKGLDHLKQTGMRFELIEGKNGVTLVNDAYNASATSMAASIDVLKQLSGFDRKIVVLGDILELGDFSESYHRQVAHSLSEDIDLLYTYGEEAKYITDEAKNLQVNATHFKHKDDLIKALDVQLDEKTIILFKASRGMAFETIVDALKESD